MARRNKQIVQQDKRLEEEEEQRSESLRETGKKLSRESLGLYRELRILRDCEARVRSLSDEAYRLRHALEVSEAGKDKLKARLAKLRTTGARRTASARKEGAAFAARRSSFASSLASLSLRRQDLKRDFHEPASLRAATSAQRSSRVRPRAALETNGNMSDPHVATRYTLAHLAQRWLDLHEEINGLIVHLESRPHKGASAYSSMFIHHICVPCPHDQTATFPLRPSPLR